ncbi:hypothetical protein PUNSTDRAFT_21766, partial [Punctularia strigosozonata HHB-11173 SS5]|uniref:uncharacterized protein n=1 Tax=Punctularia strigosozonata (strain HHB-11173) TaxID=741275 RepID=UPI000441813B
VRLYTLQIPLPKVASIIVAAIPNSDSLTVEQGYTLAMRVLHGLIDVNIEVVSYACDGTETERGIQDMITERAEDVHEWAVSSNGIADDFCIKVPVIHGQPVVMIQDSKHALKTLRNNLFSGARLLVFGEHVIGYDAIHDIAFRDGSPLYHRDVIRLDRQDDNAAARLFSASTLLFIINNTPEYVGEVVYLFVFGELVDAIQNRSISHGQRAQMALRAWHFLRLWTSYLDLAGYAHTKYCLSREAIDIVKKVVEGYLGLLLVHREKISLEHFPFLPWLHSSEPCKHVFAEARKIVKDFSMLEFYYMIKKLHVTIRQAVVRGHSSDPTARAQGYCHTYFDTTSIDLHVLAIFPSLQDLNRITSLARSEAENLWSLLGVTPTSFQSAALSRSTARTLPSISKWYIDESEDDDGIKSEENEEEEGSRAKLQKLFDLDTRGELRPPGATYAQDAHVAQFAFAATAVDYDELGRMCVINLEDHAVEGLTSLGFASFDMSALVSTRKSHETHQAKRGVRTAGPQRSEENPADLARRQLLRGMHDVLKEQQGRGVGTGQERAVRWTTRDEPATGNAANAVVTANAAAKKALVKRRAVFRKAKVSILDELSSAKMSSLTPLRRGEYGIVLASTGHLMIARVLFIYSKSAGKNAKHASVPDTPNIGAVSNLAVQLYEHHFGNQFRAIHRSLADIQTPKFALIPPITFL